MEKDKEKIKLCNMLLDAAMHLEVIRLLNICDKLKSFSRKCSDTTKESHLFFTATQKHWFGSAERIRSRISRNLHDFSHHLQQFKDMINCDESSLPKLSDIYADIIQLEQEYGNFNFDNAKRTISIITDSIELCNIPLGTFEIKLYIDQIDKLYNKPPYRIIALEPNPAGADSNITHPHVSHDILCEGDGYIPIRRAIEQGRFFDFFTLIDGILHNYNPDSPYIPLDEWEGISCYNCGYIVAGDECYYCECCDRDYCSGCSTYCQICDMTICMGCSTVCPQCDQPVCYSCTAKCKECEEIFCTDCLTEDGLCNYCEEQRKEDCNEEQQEKEQKKPETCAAVQPDSVGEIIIHA